MSYETIQRPTTNITRRKALNAAKQKKDSPGTVNILSSDTTTMLDDNQPVFEIAYVLVFSKKGTAFTVNKTKDKDLLSLRKGNVRFIKVLVAGIEDGDFGGVGSYGYYGLDESVNFPKMDTEDEIKDVASNLINGEAARIAAGGTAMSNPAISVIVSRKATFIDSDNANNTAKEDLKNAQAALKALIPAADKTLLFAWNEVETKYSDKDKPTQRSYSELWGVKYARAGSTKIVSGKVLDSVTLEVIKDVDISFFNGNNEDTSTDTGYTLDTTLMGVQPLTAAHPLYMPFSADVTLVENENLVYDIIMVRIV